MKITPPLLMSLILLLLAAACGGAGAPAATELPRPTVIPTYQFLSPTPRPTREAAVATPTPAAENSDPDAEAIQRGADRFVSLECSECHGENAEGGDAKALAGTTMTEDEFLAFLRSGGGLGGSHQYASNRISNGGVRNIYLYLVSLGS
jgi:mono/diheme cytochrome c family protein